MDEEGGVTTVVDNEIWAASRAPFEAPLRAPPVLPQGLSLPRKHGSGIPGDHSGGVILGGEDVAGAPSDLSTESSEGLDQYGGLQGTQDRQMNEFNNDLSKSALQDCGQYAKVSKFKSIHNLTLNLGFGILVTSTRKESIREQPSDRSHSIPARSCEGIR